MTDETPGLGAELELAEQHACVGGELRYTVLNTGSKRLVMGTHYSLERRNGEWVNVQLPFAFRLIGYVLQPGQHREFTARIPDDCLSGHYRLRKHVRADADPGPWNDWGALRSEPLELTAEFDLLEI